MTRREVQSFNGPFRGGGATCFPIFNKGGGNPVLLIHGGLVNGDSWGNQVRVLAKHHEIIIADSRGHGRSTRSSKPFGYELMANDYLALLDRLEIDKVALVGWSDGGIRT